MSEYILRRVVRNSGVETGAEDMDTAGSGDTASNWDTIAEFRVK